MAKPKIRNFYTYLHEDFQSGSGPGSIYLQASAEMTLGKIPKSGIGYTFEVLWSRTRFGGRIEDRQADLLSFGGINDGCMRWGMCETSPTR